MKLRDIVNLIEKRMPLAWSEEWDNAGLLVGDPDSQIEKIGVALDVTEETVSMSINLGCQLLISHHPVLFRPLKNIITDRSSCKAIVMAIKNDLSIYAAHTNWDSSPEGVNFTLAELLGLDDIEPLMKPASSSSSWGMGAAGELMMPIPFGSVMKLLKERWCLSSCTGYGSQTALIKKVAIGGGACGDMWPKAAEKNASVFITSDMSYHQRQDALNFGLKIIDVDHGEMERASLPRLISIIEKETGLISEMVPEIYGEKFIL